jgi:hypothetical protein
LVIEESFVTSDVNMSLVETWRWYRAALSEVFHRSTAFGLMPIAAFEGKMIVGTSGICSMVVKLLDGENALEPLRLRALTLQ